MSDIPTKGGHMSSICYRIPADLHLRMKNARVNGELTVNWTIVVRNAIEAFLAEHPELEVQA